MERGTDAGGMQFGEAVASTEVNYDEATDTYRTEFDFHSRSASLAVIAAVSAATDTDPLDLDPLYRAIDPDHFEQLFDPPVRSPSPTNGALLFEYEGCEVTLHAHGTVVVDPLSDSASG